MNRLLATTVIAGLTGATVLGHQAVAKNAAPAANPHPSTLPLQIQREHLGAPAAGAAALPRPRRNPVRQPAIGTLPVWQRQRRIWRGKAVKASATEDQQP
jgi:hypothetical protein